MILNKIILLDNSPPPSWPLHSFCKSWIILIKDSIGVVWFHPCVIVIVVIVLHPFNTIHNQLHGIQNSRIIRQLVYKLPVALYINSQLVFN